MIKPKILFIDAYDSFTNNIIALLETKLVCQVSQIKIDAAIQDLASYLKPFAAVIAGPGPGHPAKDTDVGLIKQLWSLSDDDLVPVLGICLGFQSLVLAFGGTVLPLNQPKHGRVARIITSGQGLFQNLRSIDAVQYHSLHASLGHDVSVASTHVGNTGHLWEPHLGSSLLLPLAWELEQPRPPSDIQTSTPKNPSYILMAVKHVCKPFYGIQFHPESVCSGPSAGAVLAKWWDIVRNWHERMSDTTNSEVVLGHNNHREIYAPSSTSSDEATDGFGTPTALSTPRSSSRKSSSDRSSPPPSITMTGGPFLQICHNYIPIGALSIPHICGLVNSGHEERIVLDSECCRMKNLGIFSIIGIILPSTLKLKYFVGSSHVEWQCGNEHSTHELGDRTIFHYLAEFMNARKIPRIQTESPFHGGLMGYINYEACLETIGIKTEQATSDRPDLCFAYVERSIVVHHLADKICVQSIRQTDQKWVAETCATLRNAPVNNTTSSVTVGEAPLALARSGIDLPSRNTYQKKIRRCQAEIRAGNSYELCLTNQAIIETRPTHGKCSWPLYLRLRHLNPAPFAAYVRLGPLTILSTSPERFMSWSGPEPVAYKGGIIFQSRCEFRPIKGTVRKHQLDSEGNPRTVSLAEAKAILSTTKEQAENLMIVDLIRHDLHGVVGSGNVRVKDLMIVEEYENVYQLVSVIEGRLETGNDPKLSGADHQQLPLADGSVSIHKQGIDILAASLPPGSMTGAPKRRSCQLLKAVEERKPRSIYSGVLGYMCVGGRGDFSVVIRSVYKWDQDGGEDADVWKIGAGGAVTALSTEEGEWEEMLTKLKSTWQLFTNTVT